MTDLRVTDLRVTDLRVTNHLIERPTLERSTLERSTLERRPTLDLEVRLQRDSRVTLRGKELDKHIYGEMRKSADRQRRKVKSCGTREPAVPKLILALNSIMMIDEAYTLVANLDFKETLCSAARSLAVQ